jgi:hypothetical protein
MDIAGEFTDLTFVCEAVGNNQPQRIFAVEQSTCEWVLLLDADETLSPELRRGMGALIGDASKDAYAIQWLYYDEAKRAVNRSYDVKYKLVLFRRSKMFRIGLSQMAGGTTGVTARTDLVLEHHATCLTEPFRLLMSHIRKNRARSRANARYLTGDLNEIPTLNCSVSDRSLRECRKLMFQRRWPLLSLLMLPPYSFFLGYFMRKKIKGGMLGLVDSLNLPIFHAMTSYRILKCKLTGRASLSQA